MNKAFAIALVAAAAAAVGAVTVIEMRHSKERASESSGSARPLVFPELAKRVNDIAEVDVVRNGSSFTIKHGADGWALADRGGYPVSFEKVKQVAVGLSQLRVIEEKTSRADRYKAIGVQDPDPKPTGEPEGFGGPALVTLKDGTGTVLASAIVGNQRSGSEVYIRRAGEPQSYAAEGTVEVPGSVTGWVDPKMFELASARVKSVAIHQPGGEVLQLSKATPEQANFTVADVPGGRELKGPSAADAAGNALAYMSFEDVAPAGTIDFSGKDEKVKPGPTAEYRTFDGEVFTVQTVEKDGKTWMQVAVAFDPAANPTPPTPEGQAPPPPKPGQKTPDEAKKEAEELSAKLSRWDFEVPEYKASLFKTKMADLLKEPQPQGPEGTPPAIPMPPSMQPPPAANPPTPAPAPATPPAEAPPPEQPKPENPPAGGTPTPEAPPAPPGR